MLASAMQNLLAIGVMMTLLVLAYYGLKWKK